ncbi:dienelactone hydrolase family protein [Roseomonas sp. AR75]|uniref:dienelactone hydrolase family protein n=1 Tax=Roseomonas sp. AR75 TaxID=2562311 RepID=UPI0014851EF6|nr:dienelactone hydrolase family protein [Roseomonas sp. AR75]
MIPLSLDMGGGGAMALHAFPPPAGMAPKGGVIFYMDAFGLRPELDGLCEQYAQDGWFALLPDLYWRLPRRSFPVPPSAGAPLDPAMTEANLATTMTMTTADTRIVLDDAARRFGLQRFGAVGHCMGARHALAAATAWPDRVLAAACLHGGRMVTEGADSPHLLIRRCPGPLYIAMARDDETCPEAHQRLLEAEAQAAGPRVTIERVDALHGWTFPERYCYDAAAARRGFAHVRGLFGGAIASPPTGS